MDVELRAYAGEGKQRVRFRSSGALLFTHRGYSGPAVLNIGHVVARAIQQEDPFEVRVSWGDLPEEAWRSAFSRYEGDVRQAIKEALPARLCDTLLGDPSLFGVGAALDERTAHRLVRLLTDDRLPVTGSAGFGSAEATGGGVPLTELDVRSMESLVAPGVFVAGEMADVFGSIGGFNFLWAFASGRLAGRSAAERAVR